MALEDVLRSLTEHWDDVLSQLGPDDRAELISLVTTITAGGDEATDAALDVTPLLLRSLPRDHPVRVATRSGIRLSPGAAPVLPADLLSRMSALPALSGPLAPSEPEIPDPQEIWTQARDRLLLLSTGPPDPLPADQDLPLIRLRDEDGTIRVPRFQFDSDGVPLPLVLYINRFLDVLDDPWGVADWWLGENAWLRAAPAGLIGVVDDATLIATAASTVEA
jgi:hypothetical protein